MSHVSRLVPHVLTAVAIIAVLSVPAPLFAQNAHPLAQRNANYLIAVEEAKNLLGLERITPEAYKARAAALAVEAREITTQLRALPRDVQAQIQQQATSLFNVRIVPLREQWKQQLSEKLKADQARDAQRRVELTADAEIGVWRSRVPSPLPRPRPSPTCDFASGSKTRSPKSDATRIGRRN
jgi:hypothetical protein